MNVYIRTAVVLALTLVPAVAAAATHTGARGQRRQARAAKVPKPHGCVKAPVEVVAGPQSMMLSLAKCDGTAAAFGVEQLSALARAPGGHRLDAVLVQRLELTMDHFRKGTEAARLVLVSGYRPRSVRSYHAMGRALDFRIDGVENAAIIAFCKTLPDTGCGYYPNSGFVHMDVRDAQTGHVAWTDVSRPGESPRYVTTETTPSPSLPALPAHGSGTAEDPKSVGKDDRAHAI
ncbi:MAG: DUF882 domain-containing protein [Myxococcota bacterium]|nr:DUF882 domain-containing protein [Myxococcota bacterium]